MTDWTRPFCPSCLTQDFPPDKAVTRAEFAAESGEDPADVFFHDGLAWFTCGCGYECPECGFPSFAQLVEHQDQRLTFEDMKLGAVIEAAIRAAHRVSVRALHAADTCHANPKEGKSDERQSGGTVKRPGWAAAAPSGPPVELKYDEHGEISEVRVDGEVVPWPRPEWPPRVDGSLLDTGRDSKRRP